LIKLGEKYKQHSVIFGQKKNDNGEIIFLWELIKGKKVIKTSYETITNSEELEIRDDFFSAIKGRRFRIPFFDNNKKYSEPIKKYSVAKKDDSKA